MKYRVHYLRIEHQLYLIEVDADNPEMAEEMAEEQFSGSENYEVVHAEEFINQVDEVNNG